MTNDLDENLATVCPECGCATWDYCDTCGRDHRWACDCAD